jgi:hypothetical protein
MRRLRVRRKRELLLRGDDAFRGGNSLGFLATDGALFDPSLNERWRQVSDGTVPAGAGDLVGWGQDLTTGKLLTQATPANRPTRVLSSGVWGLEFNGTGRLEGDAAMRDILRNAPGVSVAFVAEPTNIDNIGSFFGWPTPAGAIRFMIRHAATTGRVLISYRRLDADAFVAETNTAGGFQVGQKTVCVVRMNYAAGGTGALTVRENGVQTGSYSVAGTGNTSDTSPLSARVGASVTDTQFFRGYIHGSFLVAPRVWSNAEVAAIEKRLAAETGAIIS